jgi:tetratricopeptide (TPR) repeat protein
MFHAANSVLIFIIISRILRDASSSPQIPSYFVPAMAALLFAAHPIHTEAVTWVAGLPDLSFTFFSLVAFSSYMSSRDGHTGTYVISLICFFLAALCKEPGLTVPFILIIYDAALKRDNIITIPALLRYLPYFVIAAVYVTLRIYALEGFAPQPPHVDLDGLQYVLNIFPLFTQYLTKLFFPINLNAFHVLHPVLSIFETKSVLSLLVTAAFVFLAVSAYRKHQLFFFGLMLIVIPLLPVLYIPWVGMNTFTERYLYFPSIGFVIVFAYSLYWAQRRIPKGELGVTIVTLALTGLYLAGTVQRNTVWKDDYILFTDTVNKSPDGAIPRGIFANALLGRGELKEALQHYQIAVALDPRDARVRNNFGLVFFHQGMWDRAMEQYLIALKLSPDYAEAHNNLGLLYQSRELLDNAIQEYELALRLKPSYPDALGNLGSAYAKLGQIDKAIDYFQMMVKLQPNNALAQHNLGLAYLERGLINQAIEYFENATRLSPDNQRFRNDLANAYGLRNLNR